MVEQKKLSLAYGVGGLLLYTGAVFFLAAKYDAPVAGMLPTILIAGVGCSLLAWYCTKNTDWAQHKRGFKNEWLLIILLLVWIFWYATAGTTWMNRFAPKASQKNEAWFTLWVLVKKLVVFVLVPFLIYKTCNFSLADFGLKKQPVKICSKQSLILIALFTILITGFQLYFSKNGKLLMQDAISAKQLLLGIPFCFLYLLLDVGLVEEFFFRAVLQSRLTVLTKSAAGGIVLSALIFALIHVPGLWLRSAATEGMDSMPLYFWAAYCIAYMGLAGVFLGIVYSKTKNLWLVMVLHVLIDLMPNVAGFIKMWQI